MVENDRHPLIVGEVLRGELAKQGLVCTGQGVALDLLEPAPGRLSVFRFFSFTISSYHNFNGGTKPWRSAPRRCRLQAMQVGCGALRVAGGGEDRAAVALQHGQP